MTDTSVYKIETRAVNQRWRCQWLMALLVGGALTMAGCTHVTPEQQRLVSKPNVQFYRSTMFGSENRLLSQVESSLASSAGSSAGGGSCSSCSPGD